jgi:hypothetical protein
MKKVLIVIFISAFFAACDGDTSKTTDVKTDSTTVTTDSTKMSTPADTTTHVTKDSTVKTTDSTKK